MNRKSKRLLAWCLVVTLVITQMLFTNVAFAASSRAAGSNRYQTAIEISKDFTSAENAILAYGEDFPDALAAAPLAKKLNAPIFLTDKDKLADGVLARMQALGVKNVYVIGGTGVVPQAVVDSLTGMTVKRLAGNDRYATALAVANEVGTTDTVVVAYGENYPDALSISSIAAAKGWPILLTDTNSMDAATKAYIGTKKAYVVGGEGVVSAAVFNGLAVGSVRLSGSDRYATNVAVMNQFAESLNWNNVYLAYGENFPDALAGSAVAAQDGSAVVLVGATMPAATETFVDSKVNANTNVIALGGSAVVSDTAVAAVGAGTVTPPVNPGTGVVSVSAATQPAGGNLVANTIFNPALKFQVTAGASAYSFNSLLVKQYGTASANDQNDIQNVYLMDGDNILASGSFRSGEARLNKAVTVAAGATKVFTVAVDVNDVATRTVQLGIDAADRFGGGSEAVSGTFPIKGNVFNIISASIGTYTLTAQPNSITTEVKIGNTQENVGAFDIQSGSTEPIVIKSVKLKASNIKASDMENYYLYTNNGVVKVDVKGVVNGDYITFDLSSNPIQLAANTAMKFRVKADPISGANERPTLGIEEYSDLAVFGANSGVRIGNSGVNVKGAINNITTAISSGDITLSVATTSPKATDKVILRETQAGLIREYNLKAPGEDITLKSIRVELTGNAVNMLKDVYLYDGTTGTLLANAITINGGSTTDQVINFPATGDINWYLGASKTMNLQIKATVDTGLAGTEEVDARITRITYDKEVSELDDQVAGVGPVPATSQDKVIAAKGLWNVNTASTQMETYSISKNLVDAELGRFRVKASNEAVTLKKVVLATTISNMSVTSAQALFTNFQLWEGDTLVGTGVEADGNTITFKNLALDVNTGDDNRREFKVTATVNDVDPTTTNGQIQIGVKTLSGVGKDSNETVEKTGGFDTTSLVKSGDPLYYGWSTVVLEAEDLTVTGARAAQLKVNQFKATVTGKQDAYFGGFSFNQVNAATFTGASTTSAIVWDASDNTQIDTEDDPNHKFAGQLQASGTSTVSYNNAVATTTEDAFKIANGKSKEFYLTVNTGANNGASTPVFVVPAYSTLRYNLADGTAWNVYGIDALGNLIPVYPKLVKKTAPEFTIPKD